jgi:hypothetical protein
MSMIRNPGNFWAGVLFMGFGAAALYFSQPYSVGVASRMGPGYFPRALGILLIGLGALLSLSTFWSARESEKMRWRWRPLLIVLFSVCLFPWVMEFLGLIATSLLLVFIASMAGDEFHWKEALISGLILGLAATAVFVHGLAIPLPVWPPFLSGGA